MRERPRAIRDTHPVCPNCGYDLHGLPEPRCPECGYGIDPAAVRALAEEAELERSAAAGDLIIRSAWAATLAAPAVMRAVSFGRALHFAVLTLAFAALAVLWVSMREAVYAPRIHPVVVALGLVGICHGLAILPGVSLVLASTVLVFAWKIFVYHSPSWPPSAHARFPSLRRWTTRLNVAGLCLLGLATLLVLWGWAA